MKDYEQLVCYGKGIDSIAGDIHKGVEEAQQVYDKIMLCFPNLKGFMEASQNMAKTEGFVVTWQGRRRHLPDMMLAPYTFELKDMRYFDPFFDSEQLGVVSEYAKLCASYQQRLESTKWAKEQRQIKEEALQNGIKIHDNTRFIIDATRQCVNSRIQGSAADQTKIAARLVGEDELMKQYKFKLNLFVHDEMLGEAPYYTARYAAERLSNRMVYAAKDLCVPSKCDVVAAECWYGKEIDLETLPDPLGLYKKKEETVV